MSSNLVQVIVALTQGATVNTPTGAAYANTQVVVTDSTGTPQPTVTLTGTELPTPFAFTTSVAVGAGTVVATDFDVNGAVIGGPVSQTFTEVGSPPTFAPTTGISVTPVGATAALRAASLGRK
jgi:hypothetical protein